MYRILLLIFTIGFSANSWAKHSLAGTWEGFNGQFRSFDSVILQIEGDGSGFYILSFKGVLKKESFTRFKDIESFKENGFYKLAFPENEDMYHTFIFSESPIGALSAMVILQGPDNSVFYSSTWRLRRSESEPIAQKLYKFSKELYNNATH